MKGEEPLSKFQRTGGAKRLFGVLISNRGSCVSFADDFNDLFIILFYFTDSEVRQWQAIDTSLGATPKPPRKEAKAI